ncbi:unnamed protein product [Lepidochelys olivacea]
MVSFLLCLLPALLATSAQAQTVTCQACYGSADSCQPPAGTCTVDMAKGGCVMVVEENTLVTADGTKSTSVSKGCLDDFSAFIKGPVTVTLGNGKYIRVNIAQCNTDKCNSAVLAVPEENTAGNGLQCPTCFDLNSDSCNSQITPCTGDENYCIDFAGVRYKGAPALDISRFSGKGCATPSIKDVTPGVSLPSADYVYFFTKVTSTPAETATNDLALGQFPSAL